MEGVRGVRSVFASLLVGFCVKSFVLDGERSLVYFLRGADDDGTFDTGGVEGGVGDVVVARCLLIRSR